MTATEIRHELDERLRPQLVALQDERGRHVHSRDVALIMEPRWYREEDVERARRDVARVDADILNVRGRIAALELLLPVAEQNNALIEADGLLEQVETTNTAFQEAWARFTANADVAVESARAVVAAQAANRAAVAMLQDLINRRHLDVAVPPMAVPDRNDMNVAGLIGVLIRDVGYDQVIDDIVNNELMMARAKCAQAVEAVSA